MTQLQIGVQQAFPRGRSLHYSGRKTAALAEVESARLANQRRVVLRSVRNAYLELYFQRQSKRLLGQHERLFTGLLDITQRQYAVGRDNQHDVLRAQLELSLLQDRLVEIDGLQDAASADLAKWTGEAHASRPMPDKAVVLPGIPDLALINEGLQQHPLILVEDALIAVNRQQVAIAGEQYKPGWMVDVTYGARGGRNPDGSERADFFSAMLLVDIPLFTDKRQDKRLAASQQNHLAAKFTRTDRLRELARVAAQTYARWTQLGERYRLYESRTSIEAANNAAATLKAYQSDVADFTTLVRARLTELNTQLAMLQLRIDRARLQADLLYFAGEQP